MTLWIGAWLVIGLIVLACLSPAPLVPAQDSALSEPRTGMGQPTNAQCHLSTDNTFENIQIETTDIHLHEQLFESVLHATLIQSLTHPQTDRIQAYCYRHVLIVIRQDLRTARPTGWVQSNFVVSDVIALQQELEEGARTALATPKQRDREQIVRFQQKLGVMRNHRQVDRLEVYGPEGFMIGFDQPQQ